MTETTERRVELDCTECHFSRVVTIDGDELPAEVVVRHGEETGHHVSVRELPTEDDGSDSSRDHP